MSPSITAEPTLVTPIVASSEPVFTVGGGVLKWSARGREQEVPLADVLGSTPKENRLVVHTFPRASGSFGCMGGASKRVKRRHRDISLPCADFAQSQASSEALARELLPRDSPASSDPSTARQLLVLINPFGGGGKAPRVWRKLEPLLRLAGFQLELVVTTHAGHAREVAAALPLGVYHAVVSVSGDGLVNEIVNGLLDRPDSQAAMRQTFVPVAGGTGNGLHKSLCVGSGEANDAVGTAFIIAKGRPTPLDLWEWSRPQQPAGGAAGDAAGDAAGEEGAAHGGGGERLCWSFLSLSWGIVADVDIESEKLRCIGPARNTIWALLRMATMRQYTASLSYRDASTGEWASLDGSDWTGIWACNVPWMSETDQAAPDAELGNGALDVILFKGIGRCSLLSGFLAIEDGGHVKQPAIRIVRATALRLDPQPRTPSAQGFVVVDGELVPFGPIEGRVHARALRVLSTSAG